jgi:hypothetical protein
VKKILAMIVWIFSATCVYAVDIKYASIVNTAISDLKTQSKLSLLQGHVAINISSGDKELDSQFGEALQKAFPNFKTKADTVHSEDLYQMAVKVYQENTEVIVYTVVTNFQQKNIVERSVKVKNVSAAVMETLQFKTAIAAKNEFDVYLDGAFRSMGDVVQNAQVKPKPVRAPLVLPTWLKPDFGFEFNLWSNLYSIPLGIGYSPPSAITWEWIAFNFYLSLQIGLKDSIPIRFDAGYILKYNECFYIPIGIGVSSGKGKDGFAFSAGIMTVWKYLYASVKLNLGTDTKNYLNNKIEINIGVVLKLKVYIDENKN